MNELGTILKFFEDVVKNLDRFTLFEEVNDLHDEIQALCREITPKLTGHFEHLEKVVSGIAAIHPEDLESEDFTKMQMYRAMIEKEIATLYGPKLSNYF